MDPSGSRRVLIRSANRQDLPDLERIEAASFDGDRLSARSFRRLLGSPSCDILIAQLGKVTVGYAMVFYRVTTDIARLYSIATTAEARGKGVGRALAEATLAAATRRGKARFRLEVREDNKGAIALYQKLGFSHIGRREDYYEDGAPALRFEKPLPPAAPGARAA